MHSTHQILLVDIGFTKLVHISAREKLTSFIILKILLWTN
jgi:hypothetical protein